VETARAMDSLAITLRKLHQLEEAEQLAQEALGVKILKLGNQHEKTQKTYRILSEILKLRDKKDERKSLAEDMGMRLD